MFWKFYTFFNILDYIHFVFLLGMFIDTFKVNVKEKRIYFV